MKMQNFFDFFEKLKFQDFSSEFDLIVSLYKSTKVNTRKELYELSRRKPG